MIAVPRTTFTLLYEGRDISRDLQSIVQSIEYTDRLTQSSPDLTITVDDSELLWIGSWLPGQGDRVTLIVQYEDTNIALNAGSFQFDALEVSGPPNVARIRFLATDITKALRTNQNEAYENISLRGIAQTIADRHNLTIVGEIPDITFKRKTQQEKTDLEFLSDLASEYGLLVKIENDNLVFYSWEELDAADSVSTLEYKLNSPEQSLIRRFRVRLKSRNTYKDVKVSYFNPDTAETVEGEASDSNISTGDSLVLTERVESPQQAKARAAEELRKANAEQLTGTIDLHQGRSDAVAGSNWDLSGFGKLDGKWQAMEVRHRIRPGSGWDCSMRMRRIETLKIQ